MDRKNINRLFKVYGSSDHFKISKQFILKYGDAKVASNFFEIKKLSYNQYDNKYSIILSLMDDQEDEQADSWVHSSPKYYTVLLGSSKKLTTGNTSFLEKMSDLDIKIYNPRLFIEAVNLAIKFFIENTSEENFVSKQSGWFSIDGNISYHLPFSFDLDEYLGSEYSSPQEKLKTFRKIETYLTLSNLEITLPLFSYFLLSITFKFLYSDPSAPYLEAFSSKPTYDLFGLCVSGRTKKLTSKMICNIFFNLANRDPKNIHSISLRHYLSADSSYDKQRNVFHLLSDCPIMIVSSGKSFHKDSRLVNYSMSFLRTSYYAPFPAFVAQKPFYRDDIITIDISDAFVSESFDKKIKENYISLAQFFYDFTDFLSNKPWDFYRSSFNKTFDLLYEEGRTDLNKIGKYQLLLYAYSLFLEYGISCNYSPNQTEHKFAGAVEIFKQAALEEYLPSEANSMDEPFGSFKAYVLALFSDDHDDDLYPAVFHRQSVERNPPHEVCYYIDYDAYWDDFRHQYLIEIDKKTFEETLYHHTILKPQTPKRFDLQRRLDGKIHKCLVLYQDKLDSLDASKLLPAPHHTIIRNSRDKK